MWFERFLSIIDAGWIGDAVQRRLDIVRRTDPQNIYVENVRSFFRMPYSTARFFCDLAVREGVFRKRIGYLCPKDQNIIQDLEVGEIIPDTMICEICEAEGEEKYEFDSRQLRTIEVYSLATVDRREQQPAEA